MAKSEFCGKRDLPGFLWTPGNIGLLALVRLRNVEHPVPICPVIAVGWRQACGPWGGRRVNSHHGRDDDEGLALDHPATQTGGAAGTIEFQKNRRDTTQKADILNSARWLTN
jgi:hypothetical protein